MDLPVLSDTPQSHPNCCLSLSIRLLETLKDLFRNIGTREGGTREREGLVLSVGCGSGLLESLLHSHLAVATPESTTTMTTTTRIEGVEVATAATADTTMAASYLPEDRAHTVPGTWALCRRAEDADALLFVYPRSADLVRRYVDAFFSSSSSGPDRVAARTVVWLGPRADWEVFRAALEEGGRRPHGSGGGSDAQLTVREGSECGVGEYEMMAVLQQQQQAAGQGL